MRARGAAAALLLAAGLALPAAAAATGAADDAPFDVVIRGGTVYDGTGEPGPPGRRRHSRRPDRRRRRPRQGVRGARRRREGARGRAGLHQHALAGRSTRCWPTARRRAKFARASRRRSWAKAGRWARGTTPSRSGMKAEQSDIKYDIEWTTLARVPVVPRAARRLAQRGVVRRRRDGARERARPRQPRSRPPTELEKMKGWSSGRWRPGALGIGTALKYPPAYYADTEELIELCKVAAKYKGKYISHMRSEGDRLLEGIDEVIRICREAKIPAEIYHFKAAGEDNWGKMDAAIAKIEAAGARAEDHGGHVHATPPARTASTACIPPWAKEGGTPELDAARLADPETRAAHRSRDAEQDRLAELLPQRRAAGRNPARRVSSGRDAQAADQGKTLAQVARDRGKDPVETLMDLVAEGRVGRSAPSTSSRRRRTSASSCRCRGVSFGSDEASHGARGRVPEVVGRTRAPTATSPACSASTSARRRCCRSRRRSAG